MQPWVLNRHAIVLFLALPALLLLRGADGGGAERGGALAPVIFSLVLSVGAVGFLPSMLMLLFGVLLDTGEPGRGRTIAGYVLQGLAVALLLVGSAPALLSGWPAAHLALAQLGIAACAAGLLLEMLLPFRWLRQAVSLHAAGDLLFLAGVALALADRSARPGAAGWIFVAFAVGLSGFAAVQNLGLQVTRLGDPRAGWRFAVLQLGPEAVRLRTPSGEVRIGLQHIEAARELDSRHLVLVLPSPLPRELQGAGLPLEELRATFAAEPAPSPPERYALILHEQELGRTVGEAVQVLPHHASEP
ncbi:MAG: hypothetical protein HYZ28_26505 [Myxococcales bacterium]|nr:hypothetical protein [Myxococcales bacterium]